MSWKLDKGLENWPEYRDVHLARMARAIKTEWSDFTHAYVNAHVDAGRLLPYHYGHINAILWPFALVGIAGTIAHLVMWLA